MSIKYMFGRTSTALVIFSGTNLQQICILAEPWKWRHVLKHLHLVRPTWTFLVQALVPCPTSAKDTNGIADRIPLIRWIIKTLIRQVIGHHPVTDLWFGHVKATFNDLTDLGSNVPYLAPYAHNHTHWVMHTSVSV